MTRIERRLMLALLGCVLIARTLVPAGWMPMVDASGAIRLALCSGMGPVEMAAMPGMTHKAPGQHDKGGDHPCIGAGVIAGLTAPVIDAVPAVAVAHVATPPVRLVAAIGLGLAAPPPLSTGPPILS